MEMEKLIEFVGYNTARALNSKLEWGYVALSLSWTHAVFHMKAAMLSLFIYLRSSDEEIISLFTYMHSADDRPQWNSSEWKRNNR